MSDGKSNGQNDGQSGITILEDLYRHNRWANRRLVAMCEGLSDAQLDEQRQIGFGTLRNTLFHILTAEVIWLERWQNIAWRPFPYEAEGLSVAEISRQLEDVDRRRREFLASAAGNELAAICRYRDSKGNAYAYPLGELLLHVANHGVHHRAQALHYLKHLDRKVAAGLDYLFFRLAYPAMRQDRDVDEVIRGYGLEVATGESPPLIWSQTLVERYFEYGEWANAELMKLAAMLDTAAVDRDFQMGVGSIRKSLLHIAGAEFFWINNWTTGQINFEVYPPETTLAELAVLWPEVVARRKAFLAEQTAEATDRVQTVCFRGPPMRLPLVGRGRGRTLARTARSPPNNTPACGRCVVKRESRARRSAGSRTS
jgi:uncharacterized damage-inducible protein DinB